MRKSPLRAVVLACAFTALSVSCARTPKADYPVKPVSFTDVHLSDVFWAPRLETNRAVTIPHNLKQNETTGRVKNFELAAAALGGATDGKFATHYPFDDSDVYKVIEAAAYALAIRRDPAVEAEIDAVIAKIGAAQEPDGYLYTARTIPGPPPVDWMGKDRWSNLYMSHELYNPGHLYEAAVAYHQATGKKALLQIAVKNADLIERTFGTGKRTDPPGHEEIEIGLVKLYRETGRKKYLDLAKFFVDARGKAEGRKLYGEYSQDHKPLVEQTEAVGHAVRAGYLYTGAADVAALTGDAAIRAALDKIWEDVVGRKIYLTGGIGAVGGWEGYGPAYRLPNASAYAETCAAIATFLWNSRMFLLEADAKYVDVMERILYNGVLSGISLGGDLFFYPNPLASFGQHEPEASDDATGYMHWWPKKSSPEWIEYAFPGPARVSETSVFWFDDTGGGECRVPESWRILYKSGDTWIPVKASGAYGLAKNAANVVTFAPVRTTGLRLEVQLPKGYSAGVHEWKVK